MLPACNVQRHGIGAADHVLILSHTSDNIDAGQSQKAGKTAPKCTSFTPAEHKSCSLPVVTPAFPSQEWRIKRAAEE